MLTTVTTAPMQLDIVLERIFTIRRITRQDQQLLMSTLLSKDGLNEQESLQISKIFDAVQRGLLKVVD